MSAPPGESELFDFPTRILWDIYELHAAEHPDTVLVALHPCGRSVDTTVGTVGDELVKRAPIPELKH